MLQIVFPLIQRAHPTCSSNVLIQRAHPTCSSNMLIQRAHPTCSSNMLIQRAHPMLIQRAHPTCSSNMLSGCHTFQDNNATPHRARVITDFLPPAPQIWLQSIFGRVAKNYPTLVDVYQLTRVLQQVWQSKLFRPSSSP